MNKQKYNEDLVFSIKSFTKKELDFSCTLELAKFMISKLYDDYATLHFEKTQLEEKLEVKDRIVKYREDQIEKLKVTNKKLRKLCSKN